MRRYIPFINDTNHIHGHIIWNSVRFTDGYKYRYEKGDWERQIQPLVDEICEKHGLHTLERKQKNDNEKQWMNIKTDLLYGMNR